jgi:hypothetical protein
MALVNPNIAMSFRGIEMPQQNALADYAAVQQIQSGQRQAEVSQMQLDKMKRDEAALSTMMDTITSKGGPSDPMEAAQAMIKSRIPQYMDAGLKLQQTHRQLLQDRAAMGLPPAGGAAPINAMAAPVSEPYPGYNESIGMPTVNAMAPAAAPVNAMAGKDAQIMQAKQMLLSTNPGVRIAGEQQLKALTSEAPDAVLMRQLGYPLTQAGYQAFRDAQRQERMLTPLEEAQRVRIAAASRAPAAPRPEQPPVAVVDPVTGKPVYVSREQAISGKMAPAAAQESLPPKEIQKREAALPQATTAVTGFEKKSDSFIKDLTELRNHPGLASITGIAAGRLPGITAEGRAAQALYDKVVAKGGFQALQDLRDASKTGGALGNVSNQEGKQLTASFSAIDRRQDAADVKAALDQAIGDVQGARARMREAYDMTYSYKADGAPTPRSPGAAPAARVAPPAGFTPD